MINVSTSAIVMRAGMQSMVDSPLEYFTCTSLDQRRFISELANGEIYLHSGNVWGKTTIGAAVGIALAQCREELDGIPLPVLPNPNIGIVLSLDYKQQRLSVQPTYLRLLGDWPHTEEWNGNTLVSLRVRPIGCMSDDPDDWSLIMFYSQENRRSGVGARGHWCHADEPPREDIWREVRKMAEPGTIFVSYITATSIYRKHWYWLRADYPIEKEGKWHNGFLRLRAPAFDPDDPDNMEIGNRALTPYDRRRLIQKYASDPYRIARITGIEFDASGTSPWKAVFDVFETWLKRARDPEYQMWNVPREILTTSGKQIINELTEVELFEEWDPRSLYRVIADPSMGVNDDEHDPGMIQLVNETHKRQAGRYRGYIGEYGLGSLAAGFSRLYGNARVDPAMTGGYGSAFLTGLEASGCKSLIANETITRNKELRVQVGFNETAATNYDYAAAIREALVADKAGAPWFYIYCKEDILELMDLVIDKKGSVDHEEGKHNEAFTTLGRAAWVVMPRKGQKIVRPSDASKPKPMTALELLQKRIGAEPVKDNISRPPSRGLSRYSSVGRRGRGH